MYYYDSAHAHRTHARRLGVAEHAMDADARKNTHETLKKYVGSLLAPREMLGVDAAWPAHTSER